MKLQHVFSSLKKLSPALTFLFVLPLLMLNGCGNPFSSSLGGGSFGFFGLIYLLLAIYCLIQILGTNLKSTNKFFWVALVVIFPLIGSIAWLLLGNKGRGDVF